MEKLKVEEIKKLAYSIDPRINLFEGFSPKSIETYKGEILFWRQVVNIYGLFADCDRVQIKEKRNLIELMKRYTLLDEDEYKNIINLWRDISELRAWFCHNNNDELYYHSDRKNKVERYLKNVFGLATNKPEAIESISRDDDWGILNYNISNRFDEYLEVIKKALELWMVSQEKEELIEEWIEIQSKALFSDKELVRNVLAEKAKYDILNQGLYNTNNSQMTTMYYEQLETGGFSWKNILTEMKQHPNSKRTNKKIIEEAIKNSGVLK